jgi:ABC-type nitrate/sulfonate/bicarbonate transport system substrate-binding protein
MGRRVGRLGLAVALALSVAVATGGASAADAPAQGQRVTIANPSVGLFELPAVVAEQRGFYREANLAINWVRMPPPLTVAAVLSGEADYTVAIDAGVQAAIGADAPLKIVVGFATRPLHVLMVNDPTIQTMAQLRGRALGISALSGSSFSLARLALQANGLQPQTDVQLLALGASPNRLTALVSGQVPAVVLDIAYVAEAERQGARILVNLPDLVELPIGGFTTTDARIRDQAGQVETLVRASLRGTRFMRESRADTVAIMMDYLSMSRDVAEVTYDLSIGSYAPDGLIPDTGLQTMIDAAREATGRTAPVSPSQIADFRFVPRMP